MDFGHKSRTPQEINKTDLACKVKGVTAKMSMSLSISGHTLVMESHKLDQRVRLFESFSSLNAGLSGPVLTFLPSHP